MRTLFATFPFKTQNFFAALFCFALLFGLGGCQKLSSPRLEVHAIDVGQGDCTLIVTPKGHTTLLDCGDASHYPAVARYLKGQRIQKIDLLLTTHPDLDHMGGAVQIIENFQVAQLWMPDKTKALPQFQNLIGTARRLHVPIHRAKDKRALHNEEGLSMGLLYPPEQVSSEESNAHSAVLYLQYKNTAFVFQADADQSAEKTILQSYPQLRADVIKLAHHGSQTGSYKPYLSHLKARLGLLSCGYKNRYGHPHQKTLQTLQDLNIPLLRTDLQGSYTVYSDGQTISSSLPPMAPGDFLKDAAR